MAGKHRQTWAIYPMDSGLLLAAKHDNVEEFKNLLDLEMAPPSDANGRVDAVVVSHDVTPNTTAGHHAAGANHGVGASSSGEGNEPGWQPIQEAAEVDHGAGGASSEEGNQPGWQPIQEAAGVDHGVGGASSGQGNEPGSQHIQEAAEVDRAMGATSSGEGNLSGWQPIQEAAGNDHGVGGASNGDGNEQGSQPIQEAAEVDHGAGGAGSGDGNQPRSQHIQEAVGADHRVTVALIGEGNQAGSQSMQEANENVGQIPVFFRRVTCGIVDRIAARNVRQRVPQPTETEEPVSVVVQAPNVGAVGREADRWIVELPEPDHAESRTIPRLSSVLLRGVTSSGDGVLHIAAREGNLDLVIATCSRAGIRVHRVQEPAENAAAGAGEAVTLGTRQPGERAEETRETQRTPEDAALPFAEFLRARNHSGETCLHEAVRSGCMDMVRLLMDVDAELNDETTPPLVQVLDDNGASPLYLAASTSCAIIKSLTAPYKYQVSHAGPAGRTALHTAILFYNRESCEVLLDWKRSLATKQDKSGRTPLHYTGRLAIGVTELILEKDPFSGYIADSGGSLPIHAAARMGRLDIIWKLLEACPNCDSACDAAGRTFLHVAVAYRHDNVVKYVCTDPKFRTILNMRDHSGDTALHMAVQRATWIIFCLLYGKKEVSLDLVNKQGRTPLDLAMMCNTEMLNLRKVHLAWMGNDLLAAGAGFGPRERDDYFQLRSRIFISRLDKENESKRLSKSAGLLVAVNLLILTISLQSPFDVGEKLHSGKLGSKYSEKKRAEIFLDFIDMDGIVLLLSTGAIFCFTVAGFPYAGLAVRSLFLNVGGFGLWITVQAFLSSFKDGLSLVYPRGMGMTIVIVMVPVTALIGSTIAIMMSEPRRLLAHASARLYRLGFSGWRRSLFRGCPARSLTPLTNVLFLLCSCGLLVCSIFPFWSLPYDFKHVQSQKTVI